MLGKIFLVFVLLAFHAAMTEASSFYYPSQKVQTKCNPSDKEVCAQSKKVCRVISGAVHCFDPDIAPPPLKVQTKCNPADKQVCAQSKKVCRVISGAVHCFSPDIAPPPLKAQAKCTPSIKEACGNFGMVCRVDLGKAKCVHKEFARASSSVNPRCRLTEGLYLCETKPRNTPSPFISAPRRVPNLKNY